MIRFPVGQQFARPHRRAGKSACGQPPAISNSRKQRGLRDEIKRLQATELAIADDPFARQSAVEDAVEGALRFRE